MNAAAEPDPDGHAHNHQHPHGHRHHAAGEVLTTEAVLDIGGNIGALILYTDEAYRGREIEVSPIGADARRTHTAIHERRVGGSVVFAGIYPELVAGDYRIWGDDPERQSQVTIVGGQVAEVDWRNEKGPAV